MVAGRSMGELSCGNPQSFARDDPSDASAAEGFQPSTMDPERGLCNEHR
jgi:hypothetical protein